MTDIKAAAARLRSHRQCCERESFTLSPYWDREEADFDWDRIVSDGMDVADAYRAIGERQGDEWGVRYRGTLYRFHQNESGARAAAKNVNGSTLVKVSTFISPVEEVAEA